MGTHDLNKVLWTIDLSGFDLVLEEDTGGGYSTASTYNGVVNSVFSADAALSTDQGFEPIFDTIATQFTTDGANTYEFQVVTGEATVGRDDARVALVRTAGSADFRVSSSGTDDNLVVFLGGDSATDVLTHTTGTITFPNTYRGAWLLPKGYMYFDERERPRANSKVVVTNDDRVFAATKHTRRDRYFHWLGVPGPLTFKDRPSDLNDGLGGTLNTLERYASFEHFWEDCIAVGAEFLVYHDIPPASVSLDDGAYGYYRCRITDLQAISALWPLVEDRLGDFGEEVYDIMFIARELEATESS